MQAIALYIHSVPAIVFYMPTYRPASAPAIPPEGEDVIDGLEEDTTHSPRIMKSFTLDKGVTSTSPYFGTRGAQPSPRKGPGKSKSLKARGRVCIMFILQ